MTKYLLTVLAALAALLGALLWVEHGRAVSASEKAAVATEHAKLAERALAKERQAATLLRETSLARQKELNRLRAQAEATQKALDAALQASPDWAATRIPSGVLDAITAPADPGPPRSRVDGAGARAGAPGD